MIRTALVAAGLVFGLSTAAFAKPGDQPPGSARTGRLMQMAKVEKKATTAAAKAKTDAKAAASKGKAKKGKAAKDTPKDGASDAKGKSGKATLSGAFEAWGAYVRASGKAKTCYALAQPKERQPAAKRGAGYIFISTRPSEKVHGEISIMMGAALKEGASGGVAEIGDKSFALVAKGENAWVKDPADESKLADAMRRGASLTVTLPAAKGGNLIDVYSLLGLSKALDQVHKDCN